MRDVQDGWDCLRKVFDDHGSSSLFDSPVEREGSWSLRNEAPDHYSKFRWQLREFVEGYRKSLIQLHLIVHQRRHIVQEKLACFEKAVLTDFDEA
jgi:hypothetical protein